MQGLSPWLTTYVPAITTIVVAVATVVLVGLNYRYVRLTKQLVDESQKVREPAVMVDFEMPDRSLSLVVENRGLSPAQNVRIAILKDVQWLQIGKYAYGLVNCGPVKNGISYLSPSRKMKYYLGPPQWDGTADNQLEASLRITYENGRGKEYQQIVDFDFRQLREVLLEPFGDPNLAIAKAIEATERERRTHERTQRIFNSISAGEKKKCPMCAEFIPQEAKKCSHCHEMLDDPGLTTG